VILRKTIEYNRIAAESGKYINQRIKEREEEIQVYLYYELASKTGYSKEIVRDILFGVDGGDNGFTVRKPADMGDEE